MAVFCYGSRTQTKTRYNLQNPDCTKHYGTINLVYPIKKLQEKKDTSELRLKKRKPIATYRSYLDSDPTHHRNADMRQGNLNID